MNDKRFYWIKLKTDFFGREDIDFLLSQENGCQYVVLYQMLCLNTANSNGFLENKINEVIIPYDIKKIVRDTKYFDYDTVAVALELFKKLGLIYEQENKILKISNFEDMVGSETSSAKRVREWRKKKALQCNIDVTQEIRDKSIEYRDIDNKSIDIDNNTLIDIKVYNNFDEKKQCDCISKSTNERCSRRSTYNINGKNYCNQHSRSIIPDFNIKIKKFVKPTIEEIQSYCIERNNGINAEAFYDFYESKDWFVGKNKMKDWKACVRTWEKRESKNKAEYKTFAQKEEERIKRLNEEILKGV